MSLVMWQRKKREARCPQSASSTFFVLLVLLRPAFLRSQGSEYSARTSGKKDVKGRETVRLGNKN